MRIPVRKILAGPSAHPAASAHPVRPTAMGPDDLARYHGTDERIAVEDHARAIRFYVRVLRHVNELR